MPGRGPDFAAAYEEHVFAVYGFFAYRVRAREEAEDLTQLTFERALRAWSRYDPRRAAPLTWLLVIARNILIDHYRADRTASQQPIDDTAESVLPTATGPETSLGPDAELARALSGLEPRDQEIVALRYGADMNGPEIAELTGLTLANVQQILSRSLRRIHVAFESEREGGDREERRTGGAEDADQRP